MSAQLIPQDCKTIARRDFKYCSFDIYERLGVKGEKFYSALGWARPEHYDDLLVLRPLGEVQACDLEQLYAYLPEIVEQFRKELAAK
jgi:hypothetical protein